MVADEDVLKELSLLFGTRCLTVVSEFLFLLSTQLPPGVSSNEFPYPLIETFFLLGINNSSHFIALVIVEKNAF